MHIKVFLKTALSVFLLAILLQGCNTTESPGGGSGSLINTSFPILQMNNAWYYTDTLYGAQHHLTISVLDTITDNKVTYYKTVFVQQGLDTVDDWFIQDSSGTEYGMALAGPYSLFLPLQLNSESGTFLSDTTRVAYTYSGSLSLGNTTFRNVIQLAYSQPAAYHGFNAMDIADSIGMVRMVDSVGQLYKVIYQLDSAFVGGKLTRY